MCETAAENGVEFFLECPVTAIEKLPTSFIVTAGGKSFEGRYVVNAAGLYSDKIAEMVGANDLKIADGDKFEITNTPA